VGKIRKKELSKFVKQNSAARSKSGNFEAKQNRWQRLDLNNKWE
jgi:hypothetical protein